MRTLALLLFWAAVASGQSVTYTVSSAWSTGFTGAVVIHGPASAPVTAWVLEFDLPHGIGSHWDATITPLGNGRFRAVGQSWNANIAAGGNVSFGFSGIINGTQLTDPSNATLNGVGVPVNGQGGAGGPGSGPSGCPTAPAGPLAAPPVAPPPGVAAPDRRVVGYFTAWSVYGRNYHVPDVPAERLTHINYAFANIDSNLLIALGDPYADIDKFYPGDSWAPGALRGNFNRLRLLKEEHPHVRTLISVGGWTWSGLFSEVALSPARRQAFAASCVQFMTQYHFDGVDIDWEYPVSGGLASNITRPEDKQNYTLLLQELRAQLDAQGAMDGRHYLLTIAAPAGPGTYANIELDLIHPYLDWINVMAYDFHGSWSPLTNFHNGLYAASGDPSPDPVIATQFNGNSAVQAYLAAGIPADKIVLGAPFYGRGWSGVPATNNGLWQSFAGTPQGTWEPGVFDYDHVVEGLIPAGATRHWHSEAQVPWVHDPQTGLVVSYEDDQSLANKAQYVVGNGLGGIMFWELSCDDAPHTLLSVLADGLLGPRLWLQAATSGAGAGDLWLRVTGVVTGATHVGLVASATPAVIPGAGSFLGLVPDPLLLSLAVRPPAPLDILHWPVGQSPYVNGPLILAPCTLAGLAGQTWEGRAVAYDVAAPALIALSGIATLVW
ncbi:MAG: glycosyl hydrolase [Planctomycetes bacterium]|nr:glycosyl hydrolase [Planctomycetota bacterium]